MRSYMDPSFTNFIILCTTLHLYVNNHPAIFNVIKTITIIHRTTFVEDSSSYLLLYLTFYDEIRKNKVLSNKLQDNKILYFFQKMNIFFCIFDRTIAAHVMIDKQNNKKAHLFLPPNWFVSVVIFIIHCFFSEASE